MLRSKPISVFLYQQHTWQLNPFLFRVTHCYTKAAVISFFPLLTSRLNNPSTFPWRSMCFRSWSPVCSLVGSYPSCNSRKWVKLFHWGLISAEESKIITFYALLLPFLEPTIVLALFAVAELHWCMFSLGSLWHQVFSVELLLGQFLPICIYVQLIMSSYMYSSAFALISLLESWYFLGYSTTLSRSFSTALLPTHLFCSMNLLRVLSNLSSKLSVRILSRTRTRKNTCRTALNGVSLRTTLCVCFPNHLCTHIIIIYSSPVSLAHVRIITTEIFCHAVLFK